jgi:hypothetical protein
MSMGMGEAIDGGPEVAAKFFTGIPSNIPQFAILKVVSSEN